MGQLQSLNVALFHIGIVFQARLVLTNSGKPIFSLFMSSGDHLDSVLENYFGKRMTYQSLLSKLMYSLYAPI